jgi:hypothetical protein
MMWGMIGILIAVAVLIFAIVKKGYKGGYKFGSIMPIKKKLIQFATPHRFELIMLSLYFIFFLWWDVLQNQLLLMGMGHRVTWFAGITSSAMDLGVIVLIAFHIVLMTLFLYSLKSKATNRTYDIIAGTLAFFGVAIVLSGFMLAQHETMIRFLFINMNVVSYYHIGVAIEMLVGVYWAFTK